MESNSLDTNTNTVVETKVKKVLKPRKTIDDQIAETNALLKALKEKKKLAASNTKKINLKSKGMSELLDALKLVTTENKVTVADVLKVIATAKKVKIKFD